MNRRDEAQRIQADLGRRKRDLQTLFYSEKAEEHEELRTRLAALSEQADQLRAALAALDRESQEASNELLEASRRVDAGSLAAQSGARNGSVGEADAPLEDVKVVQLEKALAEASSSSHQLPAVPSEEGGDDEQNEEGAKKERWPVSGSPRASAPSPAASLSPQERMGAQQAEESATFNKRRAEATFREAAQGHEGALSRMQLELRELQRRMAKQGAWVSQTDEECLKAEVTKARYKVRLEAAEQRVRSLSAALSEAYVNIATVLDSRSSVEDSKVNNDARVKYLDAVYQADRSNAANFRENATELRSLMDVCRNHEASKGQMDAVMDQLQAKLASLSEVTSQCDRLTKCCEELSTQWAQVPAPLKEAVFFMSRQQFSTWTHPVSAVHQIHEALDSIRKVEQGYAAALRELVER